MRKLVPALLIAGLILCAPRNDRWEIIGPGGGGSQFYPTISPHDAKQVLVACDMTGSYLTDDGGAHWRMFNLGATTRFFEWDPNNAKVIYAGGNGLYRSADTGKSWSLLFPAAKDVTRVEMIDDSAFEARMAGGSQAPRITALAIDPARSERLYAAFGRTLRVSEDTGATWRTEREFPDAVRHIWAAKDLLYVTSDRTLDVREKTVWRKTVVAATPWVDITAASPVLYTVSERSGSVSEDGGQSWRAFEFPGSGARFHAIAASLHHPDTAYLSYDSLLLDGQMWFGVAKTMDRGRTWQLVWKENDRAASNVHDAWLTERFGPGWSGRPLYLGVAPGDSDICYATDMGRTMRTSNGGKTWEAVYSRRAGDGWTSTGLDVTTSYGVHFDPFDPRRMFITYTDIGAFRSEDAGRTWVSATAGVPDEWLNTTYWMEFDPEVRGRVWAAASWTHDLPRPKMWREQPVSTYRGGIVRSDDGGRTWRKSNTGMPETAATHILLDPQSPKDARILYVAAFGRGVYKSVDDGRTWAAKNRGLAGETPFAWRLSRPANGGIYLVVARRSEDGSVGNAADGGLYYSEDAAERWTRVPLPEGVNGPNGLTVDPADAKRLLLAAWRRRGRGPEGGGGVYLSPDAGATWKCVLRSDQHIYDVTVDPRDSRTWYACGFESSAWRSTDRGETWQRIRGYNFKWGHRVIPDPANRALIYITTFGGSVWHGPAAGDPDALEDVLRP